MNTKNKTLLFALAMSFAACSDPNAQMEKNIATYTATWDGIINDRKLELFDETHFATNITLIMTPENVIGIENIKDFYANYLNGFSNIEFTVVDVFGQGDKIVKHWNFKGTHTGEFFGIPATGKSVNVEGATLVKMKDGKIAQEQDFMDNMDFMQQLGLVSDPENMATVNTIYTAFGLGDVPTVISAMDPNIVWNEAEGNAYADGNPYKDPEAVSSGIFARIGAEHEYFNLADIKLHEMMGNQVLATLRYKAKVKKNGALIDAQAAHLWTFKDGKISAFQQYVDTKQLADALRK